MKLATSPAGIGPTKAIGKSVELEHRSEAFAGRSSFGANGGASPKG